MPEFLHSIHLKIYVSLLTMPMYRPVCTYGHMQFILTGSLSNKILPKMGLQLTLKAPIRTAADDILKYFFIVLSEKIRLGILYEPSARQRIHIKHQALFSSKDKSNKIKVSSAAILVWRIKG